MIKILSSIMATIILIGCASSKVDSQGPDYNDDSYYFIDTLTMDGFVVFYSLFSDADGDYVESDKRHTIPVFIEYDDQFTKGETLELNDPRLDFAFANSKNRWLITDPLRVYKDIVALTILKDNLMNPEVFRRMTAYSENEFSSQFKIDDDSTLTLQSDQKGKYYPAAISNPISMVFTRAFCGFCELQGYTKIAIPFVNGVALNQQMIQVD